MVMFASLRRWVTRGVGRPAGRGPGRRSRGIERLEPRVLLAATGPDVAAAAATAAAALGFVPDDVALQPDGKIVAVGGPRVSRLNADGTVDTSFGTSGTITIPTVAAGYSDGTPLTRAVLVQSDGKIVVAGTRLSPQQSEDDRAYQTAFVQRFTPAGQPDLTFGDAAGMVEARTGIDEYYADQTSVTEAALQHDGGIVVAVNTGIGGTSYTPAARILVFSPAGALRGEQDTSDAYVRNVAVGPDDTIYLAATDGDFMVYHLSSVGRLLDSTQIPLEPSSGSPGSTVDAANAITVQPDGKILLAGESDGHAALVRLHSNLTPDTTFGAGGKVVSDVPFGLADVLAPDDGTGEIIAVGTDPAPFYQSGSPPWQAAVFGFNPDGSLDARFGADGWHVYASTSANYPKAWLAHVGTGAGLATFGLGPVVVTEGADRAAPTVEAVGPLETVTNRNRRTYNVTVRFADDTGLAVGTLGDGDLELVTPSGARTPGRLVSAVPTAGLAPTKLSVMYQFDAPGGGWDPGDNGTYRVAMAARQVADVNGSYAAASPRRRGIASFDVAIARPTATLETARRVRTSGGTFYKFVVRYANDNGVDAYSIDSRDVLVTGPGSFKSGVRLLSTALGKGLRTIDALYRLAAPGGAWDRGDNGVYTINVQANQVSASGSWVVAGPVGQFTVRVPKGAAVAAPATTSVVRAANGSTPFRVRQGGGLREDDAPVWAEA